MIYVSDSGLSLSLRCHLFNEVHVDLRKEIYNCINVNAF